VIGEVVTSATAFSGDAEAIATRASVVASGTQALGATVEEMNASVEGLTRSIDAIANSTSDANQLAKATQDACRVWARPARPSPTSRARHGLGARFRFARRASSC